MDVQKSKVGVLLEYFIHNKRVEFSVLLFEYQILWFFSVSTFGSEFGPGSGRIFFFFFDK